MSTWTDLGFPCVTAGGYGYDFDLGIARPAVDSAIPDQKVTWQGPLKTFTVSCVVPPEMLPEIEAFFTDTTAYSWFTMPLVSGLGAVDHTVRAVGPYNISYQSPAAYVLRFQVEEGMATPEGVGQVLVTQFLPEDVRKQGVGACVTQFLPEEVREQGVGACVTQFAVFEIRQSDEY